MKIASNRCMSGICAFLGAMIMGSSPAWAVTITWTNTSGDGQWSTATNWDLGRVPGGTGFESDDVVILDVTGTTVTFSATAGTRNVNSISCSESLFVVSGGTLNVNAGGGSFSVDLSQSGGTLGGTGTVSVSGALTWSGGTMSGTGTTTANGELVISGGGVSLDTGRTFINNDAPGGGGDTGAAWTAGTINLNGTGTTFRNNQTLDMSFDGSITWSGGDPLFDNHGTFIKSAGSGTAASTARFSNTGSILVHSGGLRLGNFASTTSTSSGSMTLDSAGTLLEINSSYNFTSASTLTSPVGIVRFSAGTATMNGTYNVTVQTDVTGGTVNFPAGVSLTSLGSTLSISAGTLNLNTGAGPYTVTTMNQSNGTLAGSDSLSVSGTLTWSGGTMSGTGTTTANGELDMSGSSRSLDTGRIFINNDAPGGGGDTGASWTAGTINLNGTGTTFRNNQTLDMSFDGSFTWNGGDPVFDNPGTFIKSAGSGTAASTARFSNTGSILVHSGGLRLGNFASTTSTSSGSMTLDSAGTLLEINSSYNFTSASTLTSPAGIVRFSAGTATMNGTYNVAVQTDVTGGTVNFPAGVSLTSLGSTLSISAGTLNLNTGSGPYTVTTMNQSNGTLAGSDSLSVSGTLTWSGGTMSGTGTTTANGELVMSGNARSLDTGRIFINNDAPGGGGDTGASWTAGAINVTGTGTTFRNNQTLDMSFDGSILWNGGDPLFDNPGTFIKSAGLGTSTISPRTNNSGLVELRTGVVNFAAFNGNGYTQSAGTTFLNGGNLSSGVALTFNGGVLKGTGTITGNVANTSATVAPGASPGKITINGNYTQGATGTLAIELSHGITPGTDFDQLAITGSATLDGAMTLSLIAPTPIVNDSFDVITFASRSGIFATTGCSTVPGLLLRTTQAATKVTVKVLAGPGGDSDCDGCLSMSDAQALSLALVDPAAYAIAHPGCPISNCDVNADGLVNGADVQAMTSLLLAP